MRRCLVLRISRMPISEIPTCPFLRSFTLRAFRVSNTERPLSPYPRELSESRTPIRQLDACWKSFRDFASRVLQMQDSFLPLLLLTFGIRIPEVLFLSGLSPKSWIAATCPPSDGRSSSFHDFATYDPL
jgi:hypothetical protein